MVYWATIHGMSRRAIPSPVVLSCVGTACVCSFSFGLSVPREMMHPDSDMVHVQVRQSRFVEMYQPVSADVTPDQLVEMRGMGADIDLIPNSETVPELTTGAFWSDSVIDSADAGAVLGLSNEGNTLGGDMRFSVGRSTTLSDGNISGTGASLRGDEDVVSTMTQSEGEYNFYEMGVEWQAASAGGVDFSFTSGVTAIEANISKRVHSGGSSSLHDVTHRVIAVPTIGSSVRWNISRDWSLTGQATTQTLNMGSSLIGFNAQTDWRISDRMGLVAGYQILRSEFDLGAVTTDLNQEGLFARLSIKF